MQWDFVLIVVGIAVPLLTLRAIGIRSLTAEEKAEVEAIQCQKCRTNRVTILTISHLITGTYTLAKRTVKRVRYGAAEVAKRVTHGVTKTSQATLKPTVSINKKLKPSV
jgi:hypothetical protein